MASLSILSLVLECLVTSASSNSMAPYGLRFCERYCRTTFGCNSVLYSPKYLSCIIHSQTTTRHGDSFKSFTLKKEKDTDVEKANLRCKIGSRKFLSHKKTWLCYNGSPTRGGGGHRGNIQLLVFRAAIAAKIRQIFLSDLTVHLSRMYRHIASLVYVPSTRKFLVTMHQYSLFIIDNLKQTPSVKIDKNVLCMTVTDDTIFYVKLVERKAGLWSRTVQGKMPRSIKNLRAKFRSIQADLKQSFLYLNDKKGLISKLSYSGNELQSFRLKPGIMWIANGGEFSYFSPFGSYVIYRFSLSDGKLKFLVELNATSSINTISVLGEELYIVTRKCDVHFFGPQGTGNIEIEKPRGTTFCSGVLKV